MHLIRGNGLEEWARQPQTHHVAPDSPHSALGILHWVLLQPQVYFWARSPSRSKVKGDNREAAWEGAGLSAGFPVSVNSRVQKAEEQPGVPGWLSSWFWLFLYYLIQQVYVSQCLNDALFILFVL